LPQTHKLLTVNELHGIKLRLEAGDTQMQIAETFGRAHSVIQRVNAAIKKGKFSDWVAKLQHRDAKSKHVRKFAPKKLNDTNDRAEKILALKKQGLNLTAISKQVGLPTSTVSYYMYTRKLKSPVGKEESNGASSTNGKSATSTVNKHVLIGIAYAETERFITLLSERLGLTSEVLRPRLSELLGHSPLR